MRHVQVQHKHIGVTTLQHLQTLFAVVRGTSMEEFTDAAALNQQLALF